MMWILSKSLYVGSGLLFYLTVEVTIDGQFLFGAATLVASCVAAYTAIRASRNVDKVHKEVKTMNAQTIAQLADADETRRIEELDGVGLTTKDKDHMKSVKEMEGAVAGDDDRPSEDKGGARWR